MFMLLWFHRIFGASSVMRVMLSALFCLQQPPGILFIARPEKWERAAPDQPASGSLRKAAFLSHHHGLSPSVGPVRLCPLWVFWRLRLPSSSPYPLWGTVKYVAGMPSAKRYGC